MEGLRFPAVAAAALTLSILTDYPTVPAVPQLLSQAVFDLD